MEETKKLKGQIKEILSKKLPDDSSDLSDISEVSEPDSSILSRSLIRSEVLSQEISPDNLFETYNRGLSFDIQGSKRLNGRAALVIELKDKEMMFKELQINNEALWRTVEIGDTKSVKKIIENCKTLEINSQGLNNWTALHIAASKGYKEICSLLLNASESCNINAKTSIDRTPLHLASIHNHLKVVLLLINKGCKVNLLDNDRNTALHYAASMGYEDIVEALLQSNAETNIKNYLGRTAADLCLNIHTYHLFLAYLLKSHGSDLVTGYSRTVFEGSLRHNSREDHVNQMLIRAKVGHKEDDFKVFENRPKLEFKTLKMNLPHSKVGPKDFVILNQLGKGSFGCVYLVTKKDTKEKFAIKVLNKTVIFQRKLERYAFTERNILMKINHPFIVKLHYAFQTPEKLVLVLDYCPYGDLAMVLQREKTFTEPVARFFICEIILALEELHSKNIIFRDLKPDNILIDYSGHIKLTDFGLSKENMAHGTLAKSFCGSAAYFAPEMIKREGHTKSIDWYVLGAILYEMLVGIPPFYSNNRADLFLNIKKAPVEFKEYMSEEAKDLISKLLIRNPKKRLGSGKRDAEEIKQHMFFENVDWVQVYNKELVPPPVKDIPRISKKFDIEKVFGRLEEDEEVKDEKQIVKNWSVMQGLV